MRFFKAFAPKPAWILRIQAYHLKKRMNAALVGLAARFLWWAIYTA
jgi:hypothetical protein